MNDVEAFKPLPITRIYLGGIILVLCSVVSKIPSAVIAIFQTYNGFISLEQCLLYLVPSIILIFFGVAYCLLIAQNIRLSRGYEYLPQKVTDDGIIFYLNKEKTFTREWVDLKNALVFTKKMRRKWIYFVVVDFDKTKNPNAFIPGIIRSSNDYFLCNAFEKKENVIKLLALRMRHSEAYRNAILEDIESDYVISCDTDLEADLISNIYQNAIELADSDKKIDLKSLSKDIYPSSFMSKWWVYIASFLGVGLIVYEVFKLFN